MGNLIPLKPQRFVLWQEGDVSSSRLAAMGNGNSALWPVKTTPKGDKPSPGNNFLLNEVYYF